MPHALVPSGFVAHWKKEMARSLDSDFLFLYIYMHFGKSINHLINYFLPLVSGKYDFFFVLFYKFINWRKGNKVSKKGPKKVKYYCH